MLSANYYRINLCDPFEKIMEQFKKSSDGFVFPIKTEKKFAQQIDICEKNKISVGSANGFLALLGVIILGALTGGLDLLDL